MGWNVYVVSVCMRISAPLVNVDFYFILLRIGIYSQTYNVAYLDNSRLQRSRCSIIIIDTKLFKMLCAKEFKKGQWLCLDFFYLSK